MQSSLGLLVETPVKGMHGLSRGSLEVRQGMGIYGNRQFSFVRPGEDPGAGWAKPRNFYCGKVAPQIADLIPSFIEEGGAHLSVEHRELSPACIAQVEQRLEVAPGSLTIINTRGTFCMADTEGDFISAANLNTIHELEKRMGVSGLLYRFRMDLYFKAPAFSEYEWVKEFPGKMRVQVGEITGIVDDACERCLATHANPRTGKRDLDVTTALRAMMEERDYTSPQRGTPVVMGVLIKPTTSGRLFVNDPITFLGP